MLLINEYNKNNITNNILKLNEFSYYSNIKNISDIDKIYFNLTDIHFSYSKYFSLIEVKYFINFFDENFNNIKPSKIVSFYGLSLLCNIYISESNQNIYSIANIYENRLFFCEEFIKIEDKANFGILIYKINSTKEIVEYFQFFFFADKLFNTFLNQSLENNNKFNITYQYNCFNELLNKIKKYKNNLSYHKEALNLKSSFIQPPLFSLKRDIAQIEGKWYFNNIYNSYFCYCVGDSCINFEKFDKYIFQVCKYNFYLTIIDNNRNLYPKTDYLLSDFFDENIDSPDAFPIFKEMISRNFNAHYLTMSKEIYNQFCLNNIKCFSELQIIYGIKLINGDNLEKLYVLFLKLKAVIAAEKYFCFDNIFYNIDYITYIFLGHGVTYIKSYLYKDYLSPKVYNKILLPPNKIFIKLALNAGWKNEDIIKIGYPRWDAYNTQTFTKEKKSIFLMFTWRRLQKGKNISDDYFNNLYSLINNRKLNNQLNKHDIKLFFCYHHALKNKKNLEINNDNIRIIEQNNISTILKNSSLIITDFSSIIFDAIVQKKPLILFIPDGNDPNIEDIYIKEYYETINKIKKREIYLYEVFLDLKKVIKKIIFYIKNDFILEDEKLKFYKRFRLKNNGNTNIFINYLNI